MQSQTNSKTKETDSGSNKLDTKMLDISWETIRQAQENDVTLRKLFELSRDPDPPTDVNDFGMGVVNL